MNMLQPLHEWLNTLGLGFVLRDLISDTQLYIATTALLIALPACVVLNRRLRQRQPGVRAYKWGYYITVSLIVTGLANAWVMLTRRDHAGWVPMLDFYYDLMLGIVSVAALRRDRRFVVAMTLLSMNLFVIVANIPYLKTRWQELVPADNDASKVGAVKRADQTMDQEGKGD